MWVSEKGWGFTAWFVGIQMAFLGESEIGAQKC